MFAVFYDQLALTLNTGKNCDAQVSLETVEITSRSVEMFLSQCDQENESTDIDTKPYKTFKNYFKLLSVLDENIDEFIFLSTEDRFNNISGSRYSDEEINSRQNKLLKKTVLNTINLMDCLFTWDLPISKKDLISHIKKKYCALNSDISVPVFTFERYISNIIIGYELFLKKKEETAKIVILLIGKWLEELDKRADDFYLSISNGLKKVLLSTFVHMMMKTVKTNMANHIEFLTSIKNIMETEYSDMNHESEAAVHAIQAAVLLEYSHSEDCFMKANECAKIACDLDPTCSYWFYLHSLVLTAHRQFIFTKKSYSGVKENKAIQEAIKLSDVHNIYIKYHEMILLKDTVLYNYYSKNHPSFKHESGCETIINMIKTLVNIEPNDPLVVVNCARILISLPDIVPDINYGKQLLLKGLKMAPHDLAVLKAITRVVIVCKNKLKCNNPSIVTWQSTQNQSSNINKQINLGENLKSAVEIHNRNEDPVPYLLSLLKNNYNDLIKWKILAQICSYVVLFNNNLEDGIKYFKLLVEAAQNKIISDDIILYHYSSFTNKPKRFNLAELINNEIKIALKDITSGDKPHYYNILNTILLIYYNDLKENVDRSFRLNIIGEYRNQNDQFEIQNNPENLNITRRSRQRSRSRNKRKNQKNNSRINSNINEDDSDNDDEDDDENFTINDDNSTDDNCCKCRIM